MADIFIRLNLGIALAIIVALVTKPTFGWWSWLFVPVWSVAGVMMTFIVPRKFKKRKE